MSEFAFTKEVVGTIAIPLSFTQVDICDILVGAIEGGINYWGTVVGYTNTLLSKEDLRDVILRETILPIVYNKPNDEPISTWVAHLILQGNVVYFADIEDLTDISALTLENLMEGIRLNQNRRGNSTYEDYDATDYDCIMQYAMFGRVVYG